MSAEETMQNALDELIESCRGPRPADVYQAQYWGMAGAHALLLNGLLHLFKVCSYWDGASDSSFIRSTDRAYHPQREKR